DARVQVRPTVIGHTACSDELWCAAAELARRRNCHWSFHMSPGLSDGEFYRSRTGQDPLVHLATLGVLDERAVVTHALYVSDAELEALDGSGATVAVCSARSRSASARMWRCSTSPDPSTT